MRPPPKSAAAFERRHTPFEGGKPLVELGSGIPAGNALAQHVLSETVNALLELLLVSVDLVVHRPDGGVDFWE